MTSDVSPAGDLDVAREETVTVGGDEIHYLVAGDDGPPLVVLHGGIIDAAHVSWGPLIDPLASQATVYAPNFPGYGPNPMPDEPLTIDRHVATVAGFLDELDLSGVVVAGLSMGGGVAVGLALEYPDRLEHVVALDALCLGSELSNGLLTWLLSRVQVLNRASVGLMRRSRGYVRFGLAQLVSEEREVPERLVDLVQAEARRPEAGAAFRSFRASEVTRQGYRTDYTDRLGELGVPTRLIHGADDDVLPVEWSERAAGLVPDADLHVLEDCGHLPTWERTERVRELVEDVR